MSVRTTSVQGKLRKLKEDYQCSLTVRREQRNQCLQDAAILEKDMKASKQAWNTFCNNKIWKNKKSRPTKDNDSEALHFILKFMVGTDRSAKDSVNLYKNALQYLLTKSFERTRIAEEIEKHGGLKALSDAFRAENAATKPSSKEAAKSKRGEKAQRKKKGTQSKSKLKTASNNTERANSRSLTSNIVIDPKRHLVVAFNNKALKGLHKWGVDKDFKLVLQLTACKKTQPLQAKVIDYDGLDEEW